MPINVDKMLKDVGYNPEEKLMSSYECLDCGSIIKTEGDKLMSKCPCGSSKLNKLAGDFEKQEDYEFFEIQKDVLQDIIIGGREGFATERIVEFIKKEDFIYTTRDDIKSEIWIYHDGIYRPNGESYIKEVVRKFLEHTYTPQRANKVIAKIEADTFVDPKEFFAINNVWEIPVQNGILDLKTRELSEFTPEKIFFNKLGMNFDSAAICPAIDKHFREVLPSEEDVFVMEEVFGSFLLKEYRIEKAVIMLGFGRNGKGKTITLMKNFVGLGSSSAVALKNMREDNFRVCEMFGKLVNLSGDLSNTSLKETGCLKMLIGRDPISADRKNKQTIEFINYAKIIFAANELPKVYDSTDGFWDKWVPFNFPYKFIPQDEFDELSEKEKINKKIIDPDHIEKISSAVELSGLLNKAIDGLHRLLENNNFSHSPSGADIKSWWIRKSDSFAAFCVDCLEEDYEGYLLKKDVQSNFSKYCKILGLNGEGPKSIKMRMETEFGSIETRKTIRTEEGGAFPTSKQEEVWEGVRFKVDMKDFFKKLKKNDEKGKKGGFSTHPRISNSLVTQKTSLIPLFNKKPSLLPKKPKSPEIPAKTPKIHNIPTSHELLEKKKNPAPEKTKEIKRLTEQPPIDPGNEISPEIERAFGFSQKPKTPEDPKSKK